MSPANPGYTFEELAFQIKDAGARALITQRSLLDVAKAAADKAGLPYDKIILMGDEKDPDYQFKHFLTIQATSKAEYQRTVLDPKRDLAFLVYSSGTTGYPKGVSFFFLTLSALFRRLSLKSYVRFSIWTIFNGD